MYGRPVNLGYDAVLESFRPSPPRLPREVRASNGGLTFSSTRSARHPERAARGARRERRPVVPPHIVQRVTASGGQEANARDRGRRRECLRRLGQPAGALSSSTVVGLNTMRRPFLLSASVGVLPGMLRATFQGTRSHRGVEARAVLSRSLPNRGNAYRSRISSCTTATIAPSEQGFSMNRMCSSNKSASFD